MSPLEGEPLVMVTNWPPSLPAALQRWGTTHPKAPCLTALDNAGKPVYTLTYGMAYIQYVELLSISLCTFECLVLTRSMSFLSIGKLWTRSQKLAYTLLHKLSSRNEPLLLPGDRVSADLNRGKLLNHLNKNFRRHLGFNIMDFKR